MHGAALGEGHVLAVVRHRDAEDPGVLERGSHDVAGHHRLAIVTHCHCTRAHQLPKLGQPGSLLPHGNGADGIDPCLPCPLGLADDEADHALVVAHRIGVGHGTHCREAAGHRGHRPGGDGLEILLPRLAQVGVEVYQSRGNDPASRIDEVGVIGHAQVTPHGLDPSRCEQHIGQFIHALGGVDDPPALDQYRPHRSPPSA